MQPFEYPSVRYWSKEINGTRTWGRIYLFFNSRPTSRPWPWRPRQWNPVGSWRGGLPGVALGRQWSRASAYTAHAAAYSIFWPILSADKRSFSKFRAGLGSETSRLLHRWRKRCRRLPNTRPTPRALQEPICPRKKCVIWTRWRPVPVKNVNYPRAPSSRRSGLVGPHTTPTIVNNKYMTCTL